jgi:N-methylhydantoinase B
MIDETVEARLEPLWDGKVDSYRPGPDWRERISPDLELHEEVDEDLDPVTFEVIRHRLWTINAAHGDTVTRVSGSPVFASLDFNMSILTEDGEIVMNAPFIQFLNSGAPYGVRFIMETLSDQPGIEPGDVFLCNDPWIGAVHQMDVLFACPLFVDGRLFAWATNAGHEYDLGGVVPGGWPQNALDVYYDPVVITPIKIVEGGVLRKDLERMYLRQSRMPDLVALDFRAQLSGCRFTISQIEKLCEQFGPATVKGAMRKIVDSSQASFAEKLSRIPDGTWSQTRYLDERLPGDPYNHRVQVNLTKVGDRVTIDNEGSAPQVEGALGIPFLSFAGAVLSVLSVTMLYEQLFANGGGARQIDYEVEPGRLNTVRHPAAVSAGLLNIVTYMGMVQTCVARMLACDEELREDAVAAAPDYIVPVVTGRNDRGDFYGSAILDHLAMGSGGRAESDGVDTGGASWSPLSALLNVEAVEQWFPLIFLWRRELVDSAGAGRQRGGVGLRYAWTPYRADSMQVASFGGGTCISTCSGDGAMGAYPIPNAAAIVKSGTDLHELFAARRVPGEIGDVGGEERRLTLKTNEFPLAEGDVVEMTVSGGAGYGDPLQRRPELVAKDLREGLVSAGAARDVYGVAVDAEGAADQAATEARRDRIRAERAAWRRAVERWPELAEAEARAPAAPASGEAPLRVHESIVARDGDGERVLACAICDTELCGYHGNYRAGLLADVGPLELIPSAYAPLPLAKQPMELRRYCCPGCQVMIATEAVRPDEPCNPELLLA